MAHHRTTARFQNSRSLWEDARAHGEVDYNSSFRQRLSLHYEGKYYPVGANSVHYAEHSAQNRRVMRQLTLSQENFKKERDKYVKCFSFD